MAQQRVDLVIFDCDGVLIDSEILSAQTLIGLLADQGITIDLDHVQKYFLGRSFPTVAALIREQFSTVLPQSFEQTYRSELLARFEEGLLPTPGIERVLSELAVSACVATSSSPERANKSLQISALRVISIKKSIRLLSSRAASRHQIFFCTWQKVKAYCHKTVWSLKTVSQGLRRRMQQA